MYKGSGTLTFFPTRRGTLIFPPNSNLAPTPLNIGKSYIFIAYLGSLKLILLDSIIVILGRVELWLSWGCDNLATGPLDIGES